MITLIDLGYEFWRNYFATKSDVSAYEQTVERCQWYHDNCLRIVLCCEGRGSHRRDIFPEYKANRPEKPRDAIDALVAVGQQIASWGVPVVACDGFEADDVIATLVAQAERTWEEVQILSNDKDLYQLISPTVSLIGGKHIGEAECVAKFGVRPEQMLDWLCLVGDAADNVPGCPHCGPGRARDLLVRFGTLDALREADDSAILEVRGVGKKTLDSLREWDPKLARSLITLRSDAPVELDDLWRDAVPKGAAADDESEYSFDDESDEATAEAEASQYDL